MQTDNISLSLQHELENNFNSVNGKMAITLLSSEVLSEIWSGELGAFSGQVSTTGHIVHAMFCASMLVDTYMKVGMMTVQPLKF